MLSGIVECFSVFDCRGQAQKLVPDRRLFTITFDHLDIHLGALGQGLRAWPGIMPDGCDGNGVRAL